MSQVTLSQLSKEIKDIDYAMFSTLSEGGTIASRPMSNNRNVEYNGDAYFFTTEDNQIVADIENDATTTLNYVTAKSSDKPSLFISIQGESSLIREKDALKEYWTPDVEKWFPQGIDTPDLLLIKVTAQHITYWDDKNNHQEIAL
ncbi:pyridoxamine 5'-phosphate oxidase [Chimaeribacter arupi]|jgi:general stress protein 26|uniref:Pyridoxamine 5'-phosphate oxidase n=2 Tax=Yersiniaceae TaxID=1903411 RepID=A0A2N5EMF7_9GAMM|nr:MULTISPECIES: pyridoxamine 5'-phosphate oxidase family protein [Yersiniaceae]MBS0968673.1 pyridoxamine 5'-phosphate oxidase family protein [Nissabacter archeti]MDV5139706.1 pyridoxamine 5'-phosphate oxidase family protein [Chimaeribacter arupi]PLR29519.1 pyridoxamine 5'-phosphate oxidase [Chimaeribacter arupi]PLR46700.1 pyridoxamine 5'-phosphate oxidase [Chimaeribacter arupi]PLR49250.1 pyridoxamine 5'-phosphate oxidase [Chimaeribacter arupi]